MTAAEVLILVGLVLIALPCMPLIWLTRPKPSWIYTLRGEPVATTTALFLVSSLFAFDIIFRPAAYIGLIINFTVLVIACMLVIARLDRVIRHAHRNKLQRDTAPEIINQILNRKEST